jgi:hypothetical protein
MAQENDVVLIYFEDQPLSFARIEAIEPDAKPEWFQVTFLMLQVPLQTVTWILRPAYIDGDPFTMGGKQVRIEKVVAPQATDARAPEPEPEESRAPENPEETEKPTPEGDGKVISLADLKKKK